MEACTWAEHHSVPWRHGGTGHHGSAKPRPGLASLSTSAPAPPRQQHGGVTALDAPVSNASPCGRTRRGRMKKKTRFRSSRWT
jgi:hypothetical protein